MLLLFNKHAAEKWEAMNEWEMENERNQSLFSLSIQFLFKCFAESIPFKKDLFVEVCDFVCSFAFA